MTVTINGTTGISSPGGDTSTSLATTNLSYTGTLTGGTGVIAIGTNQIYKDASGNIGIGTSSPGAKLDVQAISAATGIRLTSTNGANPSYMRFTNTGGNYFIGVDNSTGTNLFATGGAPYGFSIVTESAYPLLFGTNNIERARIDSSGNLLVGTTSQINSCKVGVLFDEQVYIGLVLKSSNATTGGSYQYFVNSSGALAGSIAHTGATTVAYNASSDQRLKENIVDAPSALDSVNAIKVRSFDWKEDKVHVDYGYIAQELIEVVPEAVHAPEDPEEMMGVDFGKLTPRIIKAIQELTTRLEALEAKA